MGGHSEAAVRRLLTKHGEIMTHNVPLGRQGGIHSLRAPNSNVFSTHSNLSAHRPATRATSSYSNEPHRPSSPPHLGLALLVRRPRQWPLGQSPWTRIKNTWLLPTCDLESGNQGVTSRMEGPFIAGLSVTVSCSTSGSE